MNKEYFKHQNQQQTMHPIINSLELSQFNNMQPQYNLPQTIQCLRIMD